MAALAVWALYEHVVVPALRFLVTHPANQVIDELGERLRIGIRPFQRTKRQALIHSLLADRRVQAAAEQYARDKDVTLAAPCAGSSATRARSSRRSTPTSTSASATGSGAGSHGPCTAYGSGTSIRKASRRSGPTRPWCS